MASLTHSTSFRLHLPNCNNTNRTQILHVCTYLKSSRIILVVFPPISIATLKPLLSSIQVGVQVYWRQKSHLTGFNPPNVGLESDTKTIQSLLQASLKFTPNSEMDVVGRKLKGVRRLNRIH